MNISQKKVLTLAIQSTLCGHASSVSRVDELPYPHYHEQSKKLPVVIAVWKNTQEILDFNIFLSPRDVWDAIIDIPKD